MKLAIGSDHAGWRLKEHLRRYLASLGHEVIDKGTTSEDSVDYPDYAQAVARAVVTGEADRGVLVCATGLGMCMAANRFRAVRASAPRTELEAALTRRDNDANVLCLGGRIQAPLLSEAITCRWLDEPFAGNETGGAGDRHKRRVDKMTDPHFTAGNGE